MIQGQIKSDKMACIIVLRGMLVNLFTLKKSPYKTLTITICLKKINDYFLSNDCFSKICNMILDWFGLVWFYGISTIVGYLILNPVYTYILNIYDL